MFKWYGVIGILLIVFAEVVTFLKIQPFATWFTLIVWIGYILLIDSLSFMLKNNSYLVNRRSKFFLMTLVSMNFWFMFEIINKFSGFSAWYYNISDTDLITFIRRFLTFGTIMPAILETSELVGSFSIFRRIRPKIKIPFNKFFAYVMLILGIIFILLPFVITTPWLWGFVWTGFILFIDPILYFLHNEKSLLYQIKNKKFNVIISLLIAGYICGFLWEFWNYWAFSKWYYTIPILENIKVFEIPLVGFLAYGPFALEIYVMYQFVKLLFSKKILGRII